MFDIMGMAMVEECRLVSGMFNENLELYDYPFDKQVSNTQRCMVHNTRSTRSQRRKAADREQRVIVKMIQSQTPIKTGQTC